MGRGSAVPLKPLLGPHHRRGAGGPHLTGCRDLAWWGQHGLTWNCSWDGAPRGAWGRWCKATVRPGGVGLADGGSGITNTVAVSVESLGQKIETTCVLL